MTSVLFRWLRLHASNTGDTGSVPGQGTKILHSTQHPHPPEKEDHTMGIENINSSPGISNPFFIMLKKIVHLWNVFLLFYLHSIN